MVQVKNMEQRSYIMLYFENDYCEGAHEAILKRLMETNMEKVPGYGQDPFCDKAKEKIKEACGCPDGEVYFLVGGTREFDTLKSKKVPQSLEIGLFFCQIFIFII